MGKKGQGKLLLYADWYQNKDFYTTTTPIVTIDELMPAQPTFEWTIITKDVVQSTLGKTYSDQTTKLQEEADRIGIDKTKIKRRKLVQTVFDHMVLLRQANPQRLLINRFDWSDESSSPSNLVYVGLGLSIGLLLHGGSPGIPGVHLGASLSR